MRPSAIIASLATEVGSGLLGGGKVIFWIIELGDQETPEETIGNHDFQGEVRDAKHRERGNTAEEERKKGRKLSRNGRWPEAMHISPGRSKGNAGNTEEIKYNGILGNKKKLFSPPQLNRVLSFALSS